MVVFFFFFFQAEDGIRDHCVTGVQTCALPISQASSGPAQHGGGEASLKIPDLGQVHIGGIGGRTLLTFGLGVCVLGLVFGLVIFSQLKNLPVHESMREISELIYETSKTYLITQGKFILLLEVFIGVIIVVYFGFLQHFDAFRVLIILLFSLIGIAGSYGVAWFGIRSTRSPTPGRRSRACAARPSRSTPSPSRRGCRSACC